MCQWGVSTIEKLLVGDFRLRNRFTDDLTDTMLAEALQIVNAQFSGVYTLWSILSSDEARAKRELCINYLVAWQLAYSHPEVAAGVQGVGAIPLQSKKIGPIAVAYRNVVRQDSTILDSLSTNEFGVQALLLIQTAPENYMLVR